MSGDPRRVVPSVDHVLQQPGVASLVGRHGRNLVLRAVRGLLDEARARAAAGDPAGGEALRADPAALVSRRLEAEEAHSLVRVVNATGVVVHTNLGRAPLSPRAARRVAEIAASYTNLEYGLAEGDRGQREVHAEERLRRLLEAEGSVVVNNCAAAVLLAVNTFAEGREVLVSRGELVEIGGSFRIPEVLKKGGARLVEVGTTNKTRVADYRDAIGPATGLVLKVHRSNFEVTGFTEEARRSELAVLCRERSLPFVEDLGSGLLAPPHPMLSGEPTARACLAEGADLVAMSGDKLLGGPQAGIVAGRRSLCDAMRRNPLYRALRVDKMTLAALEIVLADHDSGRANESVPVLRMLSASKEALQSRAEALAGALEAAAPGFRFEPGPGRSAVGGGAAPSVELPTWLVAATHPRLGADALAAALRAAEPPIVARVAEERVLLDPRTVLPEEEPLIVAAFRRLAGDGR
ncbi:MAG TPA: L-seryl-tRNA(Sec) selenium transferase [Vicinamibacteria bacterium]|nr:L-seryl-tRNA(Sec) selenium transferase [Vicinamibacteria bacterium]